MKVMKLRRYTFALILLLAGLCTILWNVGPVSGSSPPISSEAEILHQRLYISDLHVDPLLWNEDLLQPNRQLEADIAKLQQGGADLVIFGIATSGLPIIDGWRLFTWYTGWDAEIAKSKWRSAIFQLERLEHTISASSGKLRLVRNAEEARAAQKSGAIAVMAGVEGGHALEGDPRKVRTLHDRGVLYMGPVHLTDNELAGSSYWSGKQGGLTPLGREVIQAMEEVGMFIDLAHASPKAVDEILNLTSGPVFCSHTGIAGVESSWRNLTDDQMRRIAARHGVIGIMLATNFLGGRHVDRWVEHVAHAVRVVGIDFVALGSDFDGFIPVPEEVPTAAEYRQLTAALLRAGFDGTAIGKIMGENFRTMFERFRPGPSNEVTAP